MKPSEPPTDAQLDRLLGGSPDLGVTEKEAIFAEVLARTAPRPPLWRRPAGWLTFAAAALGALLVVLLRAPPDDPFTPRGAPLSPALSARCVEGPCRVGDKLAFTLEPRGAKAFALVAETPDGETVWVFPRAPDATSLAVTASGPLSEALVLDGAPGRWVLHGVFSARPLSRDEVKAALEAPERFEARVVRQEVEVAPR